MYNCSANIEIKTVSNCPCCSWLIRKTYPCENPVARLYPEGVNEVKLFSPIFIRRDGDNFMLQDGQTSTYIQYGQESISVDGTAITTPIEDFEKYLHNFFCCDCGGGHPDPEDVNTCCGDITLGISSASASCMNGVAIFQISIVNLSGGAVPAGTVLNLTWLNLPANPVFSVSSGSAIIAPSGNTLTLTASLPNNGTLQFEAGFSNPGCLPATYTLIISPSPCNTLQPNPFVISRNLT